jgi:DNA-binding response OmpR family regulator
MIKRAGATVLVVEDEFLVRDFVADHLRDSGFNVVAVGDAAEAIKILEKDATIDLLFTDITLPGPIDGFGLAQWLRPRKPGIPIVLTSGGHNAEKAAQICNGDPFFTKPYDVQSLIGCIRTLTQAKRV